MRPGRVLGRFGAQETIWAAVGVLRAWIEQYGVPRALYTDWKNVYVRAPTAEERATGAVPLTQFGRMCAALGIQHHPGEFAASEGPHRAQSRHAPGSAGEETASPAGSPTCPGECLSRGRRTGPSTMRALRWRPPRRTTSIGAVHGAALDQVFRLEETRTVGHDWVVRYHNRWLQLARQSGQAPARSTVVVCECPDGHIEIRYRDRAMPLDRSAGQAAPAPVVAAPIVRPVPPAVPAPAARRRHASVAPGLQTHGTRRALWQLTDR